MPFALYLLLAAVLILLVSGAYVFWVGCRRRKELPWLVEEEIRKTSYGKYWNGIKHSDQWLHDHHAQSLQMVSFDGLKLTALWIPADSPKATIILAHGYRSTKLVDFAMAYDVYHKAGLNILVIDQRAHGDSEGKWITFGVKESRDVLDWVQYHNQKLGKFEIVLCGLSMGASTVLYTADKQMCDNVKGIIADCGFTSPWEILKSVFVNVTHLPAEPSLWVTEFFARIFAGFSLREEDSRKTLASTCLPVLLIHGEDDGFVPCEMTKAAFDACGGDKSVLLVPGADHGVSFLVDRERYTKEVFRFLNKVLEDFSELRDHKKQ